MKRFLGILSLAIMMAVVFCAGNAWASGESDFINAATSKAANIFKDVKTLIFIVGAFGLIVLAVGAIFGKMAWKTFAYLAIGLMIVAGAGMIIEWITDDTERVGGVEWDDTLKESS